MESGCERNLKGRFFKELAWREVKQFILELTHDCFGKMIQQFASEGSPIYLPKLGMMLSRTKSFCFENDVFLTFGLGIREGVSEGSRSGKC